MADVCGVCWGGTHTTKLWVASQHMLHSLAMAAWTCHHTRLAHPSTRNKLIGNTSRTSKIKESAPKQPNALFNKEHFTAGGHVSSTIY